MTSDFSNDLYLVVGPSGVGKTTLVEWAVPKVNGLICLQKAVTRGLRPREQQGREVVSIDPAAFEAMVKDGSLVAPYRKYAEAYGLFATSGGAVNDSSIKISGIDTLDLADAITVGDAYKAPRAIAKVVRNLVVIVLRARLEVIIERLGEKPMSSQQRRIRLFTIKREFESGFPRNVANCDHLLSMERPIEQIGAEFVSIIERHRSKKN